MNLPDNSNILSALPGVALSFLAPPESPDELGRLGGFRVLEKLGEGGMGIVFLAEDPNLRRRVALKALRPEVAVRADAHRRFLREARCLAAINHDHIISVHFIGEDRGIPFLVLPYLTGETLDVRLRRESTLSVAETLRIAREVADGLVAAKAADVIHRDIKPANIFLERPRDRVKLLDFGLARPMDFHENLTMFGGIMGTPAYMAPEQAGGETQVDHRADIFSLGAVIYEMLTGVRPFDGDNAFAYFVHLSMTGIKPPHEINPAIPDSLSSLVMWMLEKDREQRPQSAEIVLEQLHGLSVQTAFADSGNAAPPRDQASAPVPAQSTPMPTPYSTPLRLTPIPKSGPLIPTPLPPFEATRRSTPRFVLPAHQGEVFSLTFRPDEKWLSSVGGDGFLRVWDTETGENVLTIQVAAPPITTMALGTSGTRVACADNKGTIRLSKVSTSEPSITLTGHSGWVFGVTFSAGGSRLASAGRDRSIRLWRTSKATAVKSLRSHKASVTCVAFSPNGKQLISGSKDRTARLWDLKTGRKLKTFRGHKESIFCVQWLPNGKSFLSAGKDAIVRLWDIETGTETKAFFGHTDMVYSLAVRADGRRFASGSADGTVRIWQLDRPEAAVVLDEHGALVRSVLFSPSGKVLAAGGEDGQIRLWDLT